MNAAGQIKATNRKRLREANTKGNVMIDDNQDYGKPPHRCASLFGPCADPDCPRWAGDVPQEQPDAPAWPGAAERVLAAKTRRPGPRPVATGGDESAGIPSDTDDTPLPTDRPPPGAPGWRLHYSGDEARAIDQGAAMWRTLLAAAEHTAVRDGLREMLADVVRDVVRQDVAEAFEKGGNRE